jgi:hypothetical protein
MRESVGKPLQIAVDSAGPQRAGIMISGRILGSTARPVGGCFQAPSPTGASHQCVPSPSPSSRTASPLFTVHAYSLEQARALVAAKVAGETIVVAVSLAPTSPLWEPSR